MATCEKGTGIPTTQNDKSPRRSVSVLCLPSVVVIKVPVLSQQKIAKRYVQYV